MATTPNPQEDCPEAKLLYQIVGGHVKRRAGTQVEAQDDNLRLLTTPQLVQKIIDISEIIKDRVSGHEEFTGIEQRGYTNTTRDSLIANSARNGEDYSHYILIKKTPLASKSS